MIPLLLIAASTLVSIAGFAGLLHLIPRLGAAGTSLGAWLCCAPGLDLVVSLFTWIPPTVLEIVYAWRGVVGSIIRQRLGRLVRMFAPELAGRTHLHGPRIVSSLNRRIGRLDNCNLDFPEIHGGWVAPDGTMGDVVATLEEMYGAPATAGLPRDQRHPWFGHPVRMTVERKATNAT